MKNNFGYCCCYCCRQCTLLIFKSQKPIENKLEWETGTVFLSLLTGLNLHWVILLHPTAILFVSWNIFQNIGGSLVAYCVLILVLINNFHEDSAH